MHRKDTLGSDPGVSQGGGNLFALTAVQGIRFVTAFGIQILLARFLGMEDLGVYTFVLGVLSLFTFAAHLQLGTLLGREVARAPDRAPQVAGIGVWTTLSLSAGAALLMLGYAALLDGRGTVVLATAFAALALAAQAQETVQESLYNGLRKAVLTVPSILAGRLVFVVGTLAFLWWGWGVPGVFGAQFLAGLTVAVGLLYTMRARVGPIRWRVDRAEVADTARRAWPFGLNTLYGSIYLASDVLILAEFHDDAEVGLYRAASIIILQVPILANILGRGIFPHLSRMLGDRDGAGAELTFAFRVLLAISVPIAIGGLCMPTDLLVWLVGEEYRAAGPVLAVMLPLLPLRFLNNSMGTALAALDRQPERTRATFLAATFNVGTNLAVIPFYGALGAAATTLATDVLLTVYLGYRLRPSVRGLRVLGSVARALVPALVMGALVVGLEGLGPLARILAGGTSYVFLAWLTGAWRPGDLQRLRSL